MPTKSILRVHLICCLCDFCTTWLFDNSYNAQQLLFGCYALYCQQVYDIYPQKMKEFTLKILCITSLLSLLVMSTCAT